MKLRNYQIEVKDKAVGILRNKGIVYLAAQVRVGKTIISLSIVNELKYGRCLFLTKKSAIGGIEEDYKNSGFSFFLKVTNHEQLHNLGDDYDIIIIDEIHAFSQFPKPSNKAKLAKERFYEKPIIFLSGTPSPESYSQLYHQLYVSIYSPWANYKNFYSWAKKFVDKKQKMINGFRINDWSKGRKELIMANLQPFMVNLSQQEAGFSQFVEEEILRVNINPNIYRLMDVLKRDKIYTLKSGEHIMADSPVRAMSTFHQLCSGTIKTEEGGRYTLDKSKALYIKDRFKEQKIAIFFKYIAEGNLLRNTFSNHTDDAQKFQKSDDLVFIKQIVSGREGITLSTADCLVQYNIDFSATSYFQSKARIQTMGRTKKAKLYWIFSDHGIEDKIYGVVKKKRKFTTAYFKRRYNW